MYNVIVYASIMTGNIIIRVVHIHELESSYYTYTTSMRS